MKTSKIKNTEAVSKTGIRFLRSLRPRVSPQGTTVQVPKSSKLSMIIKLFDILVYLFEACSKHLQNRKVSAYRAASDNLKTAMEGEFPKLSIDFSKVSILSGTLAAPSATMNQNNRSNKLNISWAECTQCNSNKNDELIGIMYCPEREGFWCEQNLGITRADEYCTIDVPSVFEGRDVHVWLAYRSADHKFYSNSAYMGKVFISNTKSYGKL
jgi:hypothetical protein